MAVKKGGLGRGLSALLSGAEEEYEGAYGETESGEKTEAGNTPVEISLSLIDPNVNQPRKTFDEAAMNELANSIRIHGVISPIILVPNGNRYMIIAGERRYRAAKKAGLMSIPGIVRNYTQQQVKEISLIENLQREEIGRAHV